MSIQLPKPIRVGLLGASGRMGQMVSALLATEYKDKATLVVPVSHGDPVTNLLVDTDVVIDFSTPEAVEKLVAEVLKRPGPFPVFVFGSTGWKVSLIRKVEDLAQRTLVLQSANFSTGVLVLQEALKAIAPVLEKTGYTPVIVEAHHKMKRDTPSGTAVSIQRTLVSGGPGNVQTHSIRAGGIVGEHDVIFYGPGEKLMFSHHASDRSIFARGAIEAALWLSNRSTISPVKSGMFTMESFFRERYVRT